MTTKGLSMHRTHLLNMLERYQILFTEDREIMSKIQKFVSGYKNCFERSCAPGHITGSAWIVDETKAFTLLTHHKKLNKWLQLGGHADGDPDVYLVALREAQEESGLKNIHPLSEEIFEVDVHLIPDKTGGHYHYDVRFLFQADRSEKLIVSHESKELAWVALDQLGDYTQERSVLRMKEKKPFQERLLTHNADSGSAQPIK